MIDLQTLIQALSRYDLIRFFNYYVESGYDISESVEIMQLELMEEFDSDVIEQYTDKSTDDVLIVAHHQPVLHFSSTSKRFLQKTLHNAIENGTIMYSISHEVNNQSRFRYNVFANILNYDTPPIPICYN